MDKEYYSHEDMKDKDKLASKIEANVMKLAKEAGLDTKKLAEDMKGDVVKNELKQVRELAQRFEISGTPYLIIGEQAFPGAIPYAISLLLTLFCLVYARFQIRLCKQWG